MEDYYIIIIFGVIVNGLIFAALCGTLADKKGYGVTGGYGIAGFFFGALALIYVVGLPDMTLREMIINLNNREKNTQSVNNGQSHTAGSMSVIKKSDELPPL